MHWICTAKQHSLIIDGFIIGGLNSQQILSTNAEVLKKKLESGMSYAGVGHHFGLNESSMHGKK